MPNATVPIVVFSARPNAEEHAARLGAVGMIAKPFDLDETPIVLHRDQRGAVLLRSRRLGIVAGTRSA